MLDDFDQPRRLVISEKKAAAELDVSPDTIRRMVARGDLERVNLSARRHGITTRSIHKLIDKGASV
jgi:transposase